MSKKISFLYIFLLLHGSFGQFSILDDLTAIPAAIDEANDLALRAIQRISTSVDADDNITRSILDSFVTSLNEGLEALADEGRVTGEILNNVVQNLGNISSNIVSELGRNDTRENIIQATQNAVQQLTNTNNVGNVLSEFGSFVRDSISAVSQVFGTQFNSTEFDNIIDIGQKIVNMTRMNEDQRIFRETISEFTAAIGEALGRKATDEDENFQNFLGDFADFLQMTLEGDMGAIIDLRPIENIVNQIDNNGQNTGNAIGQIISEVDNALNSLVSSIFASSRKTNITVSILLTVILLQ